MINKFCLKFFILILFLSILSSPAHSFYKKKLYVGQFQNPVNWEKSYNPGDIVSVLLNQELMQRKQVQLISIPANIDMERDKPEKSSDNKNIEPAIYKSNKFDFPETVFIQNTPPVMGKQSMTMDQMDDDPLWPTKLGANPLGASFINVRGSVLKFQPDKTLADSSLSGGRESAELEVHLQLVQNATGRILNERTFKTSSSTGTQPFSIKNLNAEENRYRSSSMENALNSMKDALAAYILKEVYSVPLEGEIISVKRTEVERKKGQKTKIEELVLVNLGSVNGIRIGDKFQVNAVGLGINDPNTDNDLGDVFVKVGVIQIMQIWEGTATALSLAGKDYEKGFVVRSVSNKKTSGVSSTNIDLPDRKEEIPWWDFHGIRSVN